MKKDGIFNNLARNREYITYYAGILLRTRVAGSYLGFLWLYIDPLMFMLIYSFVVKVVFKSGIEHFNVFVLIGLTTWNLFSRSVMMGVTAIVRNKGIFQQVYFHKFVYPTIYLLSYTYEFLIAMGLVLVMMLVSHIPFTWHVVETIPILLVTTLFTYGCTLLISHLGVYFFDLRNIMEFTLRFLFYFTPIMWSMERLDFSMKWLLKLNPAAVLIGAFRTCLMEGQSPPYGYLAAIAVLSCILIGIGYRLISRYEDEYARMM